MISVLVIEDDPQISRLIESTLTAEGYHCECALDGQIGADCIEEKVYDLILLDLMLPQISGLRTAGIYRNCRNTGHHYFCYGTGQRPHPGTSYGCG